MIAASSQWLPNAFSIAIAASPHRWVNVDFVVQASRLPQ